MNLYREMEGKRERKKKLVVLHVAFLLGGWFSAGILGCGHTYANNLPTGIRVSRPVHLRSVRCPALSRTGQGISASLARWWVVEIPSRILPLTYDPSRAPVSQSWKKRVKVNDRQSGAAVHHSEDEKATPTGPDVKRTAHEKEGGEN